MPAPRYTTAEAVAHNFEPGGHAGRRRYTTSKLCNVYCTYEYTRRFAGSPDPRLQSLRVNAFDPGLMPATGLARTYSAPLRFVARYILPLLSPFVGSFLGTLIVRLPARRPIAEDRPQRTPAV